jgi:hypothetical protein
MYDQKRRKSKIYIWCLMHAISISDNIMVHEHDGIVDVLKIILAWNIRNIWSSSWSSVVHTNSSLFEFTQFYDSCLIQTFIRFLLLTFRTHSFIWRTHFSLSLYAVSLTPTITITITCPHEDMFWILYWIIYSYIC